MQQPEAVRLFIAISVPDSIKDEIENAQTELCRAIPGDFVRWTRREQFHLTLKFLGNIDVNRVDSLIAALKEVSKGFSPLALRAGGLGFFPNSKTPRVIWTGVSDEKGDLPGVCQAIETAMAHYSGERAENPFTGHITLGRVKGGSRREVSNLADIASRLSPKTFGDWTANHIELIRSELSSGGPRYSAAAILRI